MISPSDPEVTLHGVVSAVIALKSMRGHWREIFRRVNWADQQQRRAAIVCAVNFAANEALWPGTFCDMRPEDRAYAESVVAASIKRQEK